MCAQVCGVWCTSVWYVCVCSAYVRGACVCVCVHRACVLSCGQYFFPDFMAPLCLPCSCLGMSD